MRTIRVAIIDDEPINRLLLRRMIERHPSLSIVAEASNALHGAEQIRREKPDAVFLDIQMPEQSGLTMLRGLEVVPKVVFITSLPQHALEAIDLDAVDYLVKPVVPERFAVSVQRLERLFLTTPTEIPRRPAQISLRDGTVTELVATDRLIVLHAEGYLTRVIGAEGFSMLIGKPIGDFEKMLPGEVFARVDRSTMVNLDRIVRVDHGKRRVWLRGLAEPVEIGRAGVERLREILRRGRPVSA
ncbi:response regulator [soil metagenome]